MSASKPVAVVLICSDKRLYEPEVRFIEKIQNAYGVMTDVIALPGPDSIINADRAHWGKAAAEQADLLVKAHNASMLIAAPHYTCAGNPVSDAEHDEASVRFVSWLAEEIGFTGEVVAGVAAFHSDSEWSWKEISRAPAKPLEEAA